MSLAFTHPYDLEHQARQLNALRRQLAELQRIGREEEETSSNDGEDDVFMDEGQSDRSRIGGATTLSDPYASMTNIVNDLQSRAVNPNILMTALPSRWSSPNGQNGFQPWHVPELLYSWEVPSLVDAPRRDISRPVPVMSGYTTSPGSVDLRPTLREFLKIQNETLYIEVDPRLRGQLSRKVNDSLTTFTEPPDRPPDHEIEHLAKVYQILAKSYAAMSETPLWYEHALQSAIVLGPCRAANLIVQNTRLFNNRPIPVQTHTTAPLDDITMRDIFPRQWGMPQQQVASVIPDLMIYPRKPGVGGSEIKLKTVLSDDKISKGVELASQGPVGDQDYTGIRVTVKQVEGEAELVWECANGHQVSDAALQKIYSQVFLQSHSYRMQHIMVTNGSQSFVTKLEGSFHMRLSQVIPRTYPLPPPPATYPQRNCTFLVAKVALLLCPPPSNAADLFKTDQISAAKLAVKEEEARQKGIRKSKREQDGRDRRTETETEQGRWTVDGSQTQNRSASLRHPIEDDDLSAGQQAPLPIPPSIFAPSPLHFDFDPCNLHWTRCRADYEMKVTHFDDHKSQIDSRSHDFGYKVTEMKEQDVNPGTTVATNLPFMQKQSASQIQEVSRGIERSSNDSQQPHRHSNRVPLASHPAEVKPFSSTTSYESPRRVSRPGMHLSLDENGYISEGRLWTTWSGQVVKQTRTGLRDNHHGSARMSSLDDRRLPIRSDGDHGSSPPNKRTSVGSGSTQYSDSSTLVNEDSAIPVVVKFSARSKLTPALHHDDTSSDDDDGWDGEQAIANEADLYSNALRHLQGSVVPRFLGLWKTMHEGETIWMMVLEKLSSRGGCEEDVVLDDSLVSRLSILRLYTLLHSAGVVHNDITSRHIMSSHNGGYSSTTLDRGSNFLYDPTLRLIDFDSSNAHATADQIDAELEQVMRWLGFDENVWVLFGQETRESQGARQVRRCSRAL